LWYGSWVQYTLVMCIDEMITDVSVNITLVCMFSLDWRRITESAYWALTQPSGLFQTWLPSSPGLYCHISSDT